MSTAFFTVVLSTVGFYVLSVLGCIACCCCFCALPLISIAGKVCFSLFGGKRKSGPRSSSASGTTSMYTAPGSAQYEMVQDCEGGSDVVHYADEVGFAPAAVTGDEAGERLVEAYLVPPLVNVQTTNSDAVFASQVAIDGAAAGSVNQSDGLASSAAKRSSGGFKDLWAALLFLINVAAVIYLAVQSYYAQKEGVTSPAAIDLDDDTLSSMEALLVFTISLTTFASLLGSAFIAFMMNHSSSIISLMLYLNIGVLAFTSACCLITFNIIGAAIFFALAAVSYCYLLSVQSRIPFASAVLSIASDVIKKNYSGLILTAYMSLAVQIVWFILWSAAFIGVFQLMSTDGSAQAGEERRNRGSRSEGDDAVGDEVAANGWLVFVMVLSLYWGVQTIASVLKTTVCGTLACWWFQPNRIAPVRGSLFRSLTTSFGSICFGSLIVAVVQALREMAHMARNSARRRSNRNNEQAAAMIQLCVFCVLECLLKYLERALEYFNRYAFCYVAAYGLSFLESGKQVTGMFTRRGWTAIINDSLISRVFTFGVLSLALITSITGAFFSLLLDVFLAHSFSDVNAFAAYGMGIGAVVGTMVGLILTTTLDSAVAMVFVCFAEDPFALQTNHFDQYLHLSEKWDQLHPHTLPWLHTPAAHRTDAAVAATVVAPAVPVAATAPSSSSLPWKPTTGVGAATAATAAATVSGPSAPPLPAQAWDATNSSLRYQHPDASYSSYSQYQDAGIRKPPSAPPGY